MDNRPIGFLDSGVGGLTVVRELMRQLPHEEVIYIGDSARAPYGPRPAVQIRDYTWQLVNFLLTKDVKMIVIACNTATAVVWEEIKEKLEEEKMESSIYITLETLKYLKKGGRITPAAAAIGTVLNLKPVLQIQGEKLDAYAKVRGKKQAKRVMMKAMQEDWDTRFKKYVESGEMCLQMAYAGNKEEAEEFKKEVQAAFPGIDIHMDPLSLSVACHIGHGALAVACAKKVTV